MPPTLQRVRAVGACPWVGGAWVGFWAPGPTCSGNGAHVRPNPMPTSPAHHSSGEKKRIASLLSQVVYSLCWHEHHAPAGEAGHLKESVHTSLGP